MWTKEFGAVDKKVSIGINKYMFICCVKDILPWSCIVAIVLLQVALPHTIGALKLIVCVLCVCVCVHFTGVLLLHLPWSDDKPGEQYGRNQMVK